ncbi:hypothetical protein DPMN_040939 [Dreissena polymorpha]|uniref:Uncharacterized protein n=1 Tax=Dreissena polymorpha TaxID=45954 RepID=A0A9D4HTI4_DREPO|nr:hypothetical protein DPMN_040939 [Dreissena polymorpha]
MAAGFRIQSTGLLQDSGFRIQSTGWLQDSVYRRLQNSELGLSSVNCDDIDEIEEDDRDKFADQLCCPQYHSQLQYQSPGIGHNRDHHMATPVSWSLPDGIGQGHRLMPDHLASAIRSLSRDNTGHDMTGTSPGTLTGWSGHRSCHRSGPVRSPVRSGHRSCHRSCHRSGH